MTGSTRTFHLLLALMLTCAGAVTSAAPVGVAGAPAPQATAQALSPSARLSQRITFFLRDQTQGLPGEVSFQIQVPESLSLPDCPDFVLNSPPSARPMGRSSVIVRCPGVTGSWSLTVPVQIQVLASYLVTTRQVPAGQLLTAADLSSRSGDLGLLPANTLTLPEQAIGQAPRSALGAGQPLRREMLRAPEVIRAGQSVKVFSGGAGFEVSNTGTSLNSGGIGTTVRVRLPSGQVVSGVATGTGTVRLSP